MIYDLGFSFFYFQANRLHDAVAVIFPISRIIIHMKAGKTVGAVVAAAGRMGFYSPTAGDTGEALVVFNEHVMLV